MRYHKSGDHWYEYSDIFEDLVERQIVSWFRIWRNLFNW